ncbi:MAG: hypothetical protein AAF547_09570 [Actinomycetota bacterium]
MTEHQIEPALWLRLLFASAGVLALSLGLVGIDGAAVGPTWGPVAEVVSLAVLGVGLAYVGRLIGLVIAATDQT